MFNFKCTECELEIQADYKYIGYAAECPECGNVQIIPDPPMPPKTEYHGYIIEDQLASDLMWTTYKASPVVDNGTPYVILKVPSTFFLQNVSDFDAFIATLDKQGSLDNKAYPKLLGKSLIEGKVFFVYEFIDGGRLMSSLATGKPIFSEQDSLLIIRRIAVVLRDLWNSEQMIHQNLTPANVTILPDQSVKIRNLGISQFALTDDALMENGFNIWEYKYLSPEFMEDGDAGQQVSAIYSLGGLLYLLLTGTHPYDRVEFEDINSTPLVPVKDMVDSVSTKVARLTELMMDKDIDVRLASWQTVIDRIDDVIGSDIDVTQTTVAFKNQFKDLKKTVPRRSAVGHSAGSFKRKKTFSKTKKKPSVMTETMAKLLPDGQKIDGVNANWRKKKKKGIPHLGLIIFLIVTAVITPLLFMLRDNHLEKQRLEKEAKIEQNRLIREKNELIRDERLAKVQALNEERMKLRKAAEARAKARTSTDSKEGTTTGDSILDEFNEILAYTLQNKNKFAEPKARYEALLEKCISSKKFALMGKISTEIDKLDIAKEELVKVYIRKAKDQIKPILENREFDVAREKIKEYKTPNPEVTSRIHEKLLASVDYLEVEADESTKKELSAAFIRIKEKLDAVIALLFADEFTQAKLTLTKLSSLKENTVAKKYLDEMIGDIDRLEGFNSELAKGYRKLTSGSTKINLATGKVYELFIVNATPDGLSVKRKSNSTTTKELKYSAISASDKIAVINSQNPVSSFFKGLVLLKNHEFSDATENFLEMPEGLSDSFAATLKNCKAQVVIAEILSSFGVDKSIEDLRNISRELAQAKFTSQKAVSLFGELEEYINEYKETPYYKANKSVVAAIASICNKRASGEKLSLKEVITGDSALERGENLANAIRYALKGSTLKLSDGPYHFEANRGLTIRKSDITLIGSAESLINAPVTLLGSNVKIINFKLKSLTIGDKAAGSSIENSSIDNLTINGVKNLTFSDNLIHSSTVTGSSDIIFRHCSFVEHKKEDAPLTLKQSDVEVEDSLIYSLGQAVSFVKVGKKKIPKLRLKRSLIFGETGFGTVNEDGKKKLLTKKIDTRAYISASSVIYELPVFNDAAQGDFSLSSVSPGVGEASDKADVGIAKR